MERLTEKQKDVIYWAGTEPVERNMDPKGFYKRICKGAYFTTSLQGFIMLDDISPCTVDSLEKRGYLKANMSKEEEKVQIALGVIAPGGVYCRSLKLTDKGTKMYKYLIKGL